MPDSAIVYCKQPSIVCLALSSVLDLFHIVALRVADPNLIFIAYLYTMDTVHFFNIYVILDGSC